MMDELRLREIEKELSIAGSWYHDRPRIQELITALRDAWRERDKELNEAVKLLESGYQFDEAMDRQMQRLQAVREAAERAWEWYVNFSEGKNKPPYHEFWFHLRDALAPIGRALDAAKEKLHED